MAVGYPTKHLLGSPVRSVRCRPHRARFRRVLRAAAETLRRPTRRTSRASAALTFADLLERVRETAAGYRALGLDHRRPGRGLGAEQHRLGGRCAGRVVRRRRCWCRPTAATPATRWPTSSTAPTPVLVVVADGFLGRTQIADLRAAERAVLGDAGHRHRRPRPARRPTADRGIDDAPTRCTPDDVADILFTSGTTGRPKGAMSAHRQTIGVAGRLGRARRGHGRGPLPRGEPVLPLLRLQGRHRGRAADRRDALPGRGLRRRGRRCG